MLLLVAVALIGAVASKPQGIIPMGYNIVAPNVAPTMFPVPYRAISAASIPSHIPAVIAAPMTASVPAAIPGPVAAESIPGPALPMGSFPAATFPLASVPAAAVTGTTIPAAPSVFHMGPSVVYPSLDINMIRSTVNPSPVEETPEVKKARVDFENAYNKAQSGAPETSSVSRAKRDIQRVLPYGYNLPYSGYVTPYGHISGPVPSSHVLPSNVLHSPYFSHV